MNRPCPICGSSNREHLYTYHLTSGEQQDIYACNCGFSYADTTGQPVDYNANPTYSAVEAVGSAVNEFDRARLAATAQTISTLKLPANAKVLDVGCASGGLLDILRDRGYSNLTGLDLSQSCVDLVNKKAHNAICGTLHHPGLKRHGYSLIILSHVLEHIPEPLPFLRNLLALLAWDGHLYIEVPDAQRYAQFLNHPFLDFNSEHINHFDACSLRRALDSVGLFGGMVQERTFQLNDGSPYPALWVLARRSRAVMKMAEFVAQSRATLAVAESRLLAQLNGYSSVIVWGAGKYLEHILPMLATKRIVRIVDRNPALWGSTIAGTRVTSPDLIRPDLPIVIASIVAAKAIRRDIEAAGLKNIIVEVL